MYRSISLAALSVVVCSIKCVANVCVCVFMCVILIQCYLCFHLNEYVCALSRTGLNFMMKNYAPPSSASSVENGKECIRNVIHV